MKVVELNIGSTSALFIGEKSEKVFLFVYGLHGLQKQGHRQYPHADCRHGIDHTHRHPRHATGRTGDEKAGCNIELIVFVPLHQL